MSTYTPKIVIEQFGKAEKAKKENANGEIQLLIEKSFSDQEKYPDDVSKQYFNVKKQH